MPGPETLPGHPAPEGVVDALDDALAALALLRRQVDHGEVDGARLAELADTILRTRLLPHPLVAAALAALNRSAGQATAGAPDVAAPGEGVPRPVAAPGTAADGEAQPEPAGGSGEAASPEETGEAEPPSPHKPAEDLVLRLAALVSELVAKGAAVPEKLAGFGSKAKRALPRLPEDEQKGEHLAKILFEGLRVLDQLEQALVWSRHRDSALSDLRSAIGDFLAESHGIEFVPPARLAKVDPTAGPEGVKLHFLPAPFAEGTLLWVDSRAFRKQDNQSGHASLWAAQGSPGLLRTKLIEIWQAVESDGAPNPRADLDRLSRWIRELRDDDPVACASTARHTLNLVHDRDRNGTHAALTKWLLAELAKHDIHELPAKVGKRFGDAYSPSKYERQLEYSDRPPGTIVRIITIGLVDGDGLPLQKAVLGVSKGKG